MMKRITFLFAFLFSISLIGQGLSNFSQNDFNNPQNTVFTTNENSLDEEDVVFYVGEGNQTAYVIIDFREEDGYASFAWGVDFEGDELTVYDALLTIQQEDSNFTFEASGGSGSYFLEDIYYNNFAGEAGVPDWWSTWSGDSPENLEMSTGLNDPLIAEEWYGFSYGFSPEPVQPQFVYAAYNADWFDFDEVDSWFGEGENQTVITIDFVSDETTEEVTFAWGLKFEEESISGKAALEFLAAADDHLTITFNDADELITVNYDGLERTADVDESWHSFIGNNLSDYAPAEEGIFEMIEDGKIFGISFGGEKVRRPFIPTIVENPDMGISDVDLETAIKIWPNPTADRLHIETAVEIQNILVFDMQGRKLLESQSKTLDVNNLSSGNYLLQIESKKTMITKRFIKH